MGVATTAFNGERVSLVPCGVSSKTRVDRGRPRFDPGAHSGFYVPLINGSDTNFSHPYVLTYPKNGYPTDIPRPQLTVTNLTGFSRPWPRSSRSSAPSTATSCGALPSVSSSREL